jgi:hypothetical protein
MFVSQSVQYRERIAVPCGEIISWQSFIFSQKPALVYKTHDDARLTQRHDAACE